MSSVHYLPTGLGKVMFQHGRNAHTLPLRLKTQSTRKHGNCALHDDCKDRHRPSCLGIRATAHSGDDDILWSDINRFTNRFGSYSGNKIILCQLEYSPDKILSIRTLPVDLTSGLTDYVKHQGLPLSAKSGARRK